MTLPGTFVGFSPTTDERALARRYSLERRTFLRASALSAGMAAAGAPAVSAASPLRVQILLYEGVEELDSIAPYDVLSMAGLMGGAIRTSLVSITKPTMVTASRGL